MILASKIKIMCGRINMLTGGDKSVGAIFTKKEVGGIALLVAVPVVVIALLGIGVAGFNVLKPKNRIKERE